MLIQQKLLFSKEECDLILYLINPNPQNWNFKDRKYNSYVIEYNEDTDWLSEKLKHFFEEKTGLEIIKIKNQIHFHKFTNGDWFGKHNDIRDNRLYAVGVLLNNDFDGGEFKLYTPNEITLSKITGNAYIFDVGIYHEITPIQLGDRYSLLWFLKRTHKNRNK